MKVDRAQQILNSSQNIEVTYQGTPIWITDVHNSTGTAHVKMPKNSTNLVEVSVEELTEQQ